MKIRTAVLGYGRSGGAMHAGAIEKNSAFEMTAVCDTDEEARNKASERFKCSTYENYHEMLDKEDLDLVCVITRNDQHCQMTCDCLEAGKNVLVTKPWAADEKEARRMVKVAETTGMQLLPWLPARWGCELTRLKQLVAEKAIGNIFLVRHVVTGFGTRCDWQTEKKCAGGYLLNWGPHIVDPPLVLMGYDIATVFGRLRQTINPGDVEDLFFGVMTMADGTIVQTEFTIAVEDMPKWILQGDGGTIIIRGKEMTVHKQSPSRPTDPTAFATMKADGSEVTVEDLEGSIYGLEHDIYVDIADAIAGKKAFPVQPNHALQLTRALDAIRRSSEENSIVTM